MDVCMSVREAGGGCRSVRGAEVAVGLLGGRRWL